ncbi:MAG: hypothetical protein U0P45_03560 [Acidimicrobiales bacterium]
MAKRQAEVVAGAMVAPVDEPIPAEVVAEADAAPSDATPTEAPATDDAPAADVPPA